MTFQQGQGSGPLATVDIVCSVRLEVVAKYRGRAVHPQHQTFVVNLWTSLHHNLTLDRIRLSPTSFSRILANHLLQLKDDVRVHVTKRCDKPPFLPSPSPTQLGKKTAPAAERTQLERKVPAVGPTGVCAHMGVHTGSHQNSASSRFGVVLQEQFGTCNQQMFPVNPSLKVFIRQSAALGRQCLMSTRMYVTLFTCTVTE